MVSGQSAGAGRPGVRLSAPDDQPGASGQRPCRSGNGLLSATWRTASGATATPVGNAREAGVKEASEGRAVSVTEGLVQPPARWLRLPKVTAPDPKRRGGTGDILNGQASTSPRSPTARSTCWMRCRSMRFEGSSAAPAPASAPAQPRRVLLRPCDRADAFAQELLRQGSAGRTDAP